MASVLGPVLDLIYPPKCALCQCLAEGSPCVMCRDEFVPSEPWCQFLDEGVLAYRATLFHYEGRAAQAVRRLKYARSTSLAAYMAKEVADGILRLGEHADCVVPVPIHWSRRCTRGFNQAELLCQAVPSGLVKPNAIRRTRPTRPQVGLSRDERLTNLENAFSAQDVEGKHVLLVDDVLTSGQTARECAKALLAAGAVEVGILAFAGEVLTEARP